MKGKRILLLTGASLHNLNTLFLFIKDKELNVVGACIADKKTQGIDFSYLKIAIKKEGVFKVFFQIVQRVIYKLVNSKKDKKIKLELYDEPLIRDSINSWNQPIHYTENYHKKETFDWIKSQNPDIIVVHTPYWVGKKIRTIVNGNIIGGHPGIVPSYRGIHSSFWAIYNKAPEKVGYSVFWLDSGVDTGDLISQGIINIEEGDSYITLGWKGMIEIAKQQIRVLKKVNRGIELPRTKHIEIPENSYYSHPTIFNYIKYRFSGNKVR
ncbi:formyltransferase family protein [Aquimarina sp. AD1]|uniref:formyltransferase family protein n=1 Tax=Aquimarina sp. (strain AD1) TaxID=1714848 RepID=UPI001314C761|nr:formyltransferase family protein [Aquimarina sp. AD1]